MMTIEKSQFSTTLADASDAGKNKNWFKKKGSKTKINILSMLSYLEFLFLTKFKFTDFSSAVSFVGRVNELHFSLRRLLFLVKES